jgi:glucosamine--fructose-6-phosphate aminotransferase (isomerizing)
MSGLVGIVNGHPVAHDLVGALSRLESRGYDTAGLAVAGPGFAVRRVVGPATALTSYVGDREFAGRAGIANARWSSAERPEGRGALPQVWQGVAVVHNGIVENHAALRRDLKALGHSFETEADSEIIPHLIAAARAEGCAPDMAVRQACARMQGTYAMAVLFGDAPDRVLAASCGSPVVVARGAGGAAVASDAMALAGLADEYATLEDGDVAELANDGVRILDRDGHPAERVWRSLTPSDPGVGADFHDTLTRRDIACNSRALQRADAGLRGAVLPPSVAVAERLLIVAGGSALHAAAAARDWIEILSGVPCDVEMVSEWRDRAAPLARGTVGVIVSRSGGSGDAFACQQAMRERGVPTVAVVPTVRSALARTADLCWPTEAAPELGVAATVSVSTQMLALLRLGLALGTARGTLAGDRLRQAERALAEAPLACALAEAADARLSAIAVRIAQAQRVVVLGRGWGAALAADAALKLTQLANIHAIAAPAGEVRNGPLAMVSEGVPVLVLASADQHFAKIAASAEEIRARGGHVIALAEASCSASLDHAANEVLALPGRGLAQMFAQTVAVQLVAYHTAHALGRDVDRPRHLA